ncbi:hypothetical protein D9M71_404280 [compost metagenome]
MQQPRAGATLLVNVEYLGQGAAILGRVQRQLPVVLGEFSQQWFAEVGTALERQAKNQVHALGRAQGLQCMQQRLNGASAMVRRAIGRCDQNRRDLRVGAHFLLKHLQVQALGIEATFDRHVHVCQ